MMNTNIIHGLEPTLGQALERAGPRVGWSSLENPNSGSHIIELVERMPVWHLLLPVTTYRSGGCPNAPVKLFDFMKL